ALLTLSLLLSSRHCEAEELPIVDRAGLNYQSQVYNESTGDVYYPEGPLLPCRLLPPDLVKCNPPLDLKGNVSLKDSLGHGCTKWGGQSYHKVEHTKLQCFALQDIECYGNRTFLRGRAPCLKYSGHYFLTTLLYSVFLGFLAIDRFCLGHTGAAIGKMLCLGGFGIWWIVDIILLCTGSLRPADESSWMPYY
ncbi:hypothetical protein BOX15_Mlig022784g3, partial [Macrostomum lignano]